MPKNVGNTDKIVRIALAAVLLVGAFLFQGTFGTLGIVVAGVAALVLVGTALVGTCGLYALFGFSTCPVEGQKQK
jgi:hypothetical protein